MKSKDIWLAAGLMVVFALTRWPAIFPQQWGSFSAAYAICFCAGVYFSKALVWWAPLLTLFLSDVALNVFYYREPAVSAYMLPNYLMYAALVGLGRLHSRNSKWWQLVFGGVGGAFLFFVVTNTVAWLQNDQYPKTLAGWLAAMTTGIPGWPPPWMFLRNSLLSGGLFTGLFAAAMKLTATSESELDKEPIKASEEDDEVPEPEKADA